MFEQVVMTFKGLKLLTKIGDACSPFIKYRLIFYFLQYRFGDIYMTVTLFSVRISRVNVKENFFGKSHLPSCLKRSFYSQGTHLVTHFDLPNSCSSLNYITQTIKASVFS